MDLEGNLILDRRPARRWVSAIAVVIPVVACVAGVTWFVRAFISPPTVAIPGPMVLSAVPPAPPPAPPTRSEPPAPKQESMWAAAVMSPTPSAPAAASGSSIHAPPTVSAFGVAPQTANPFPPPPSQSAQTAAAPQAFADPIRDDPPPAAAAATPAVEVPATPIVGRIPLPRRRPPVTALAAAQTVPTPRPRPTEVEAAAPTPSPFLHAEPDYDRHGAE